MEKITDKIAGLPKDGTYFSLEFFPPKTQMVCTVALVWLSSPLANHLQKGILQSARSLGAHVAGSAASLRQRNLGRRRLYCIQVPRTRRNMPEADRAYNLSASHMHKHAARGHR